MYVVKAVAVAVAVSESESVSVCMCATHVLGVSTPHSHVYDMTRSYVTYLIQMRFTRAT